MKIAQINFCNNYKTRKPPTPQIMMKNTYKLFSGVLLLCIALYSCSADTDEAPQESALETELKLENAGVYEIGSTTYVFKKTGETIKFINEDRAFDFEFGNEMSFTAQRSGSRHTGESLLITNSETGEFVKYAHFEELKNGEIKFDIELSTGQKFYSVVYTPGKNSPEPFKWHEEPPMAFTTTILEATIQDSQQKLSPSCKSAIEACVSSGGYASVVLNNQHGWFTTPATCEVVCNR